MYENVTTTRIYCSAIDIEVVAIAMNEYKSLTCVQRSPSGKLESFNEDE